MAVFRCFFGRNKFSRPNGWLSPIACLTYLESYGTQLWFGLSGNHFSASYKASDFCWQTILYFPGPSETFSLRKIIWFCWICWEIYSSTLLFLTIFSAKIKKLLCQRNEKLFTLISWNSSSCWLHLFFSFWYWTFGGQKTLCKSMQISSL